MLDEEDDEALTTGDRIFWHFINCMVAFIVGLVAAGAADGQVWIGFVAGAVWIAIGIVLARVGFWNWLLWFLEIVTLPIRLVFMAIGAVAVAIGSFLGQVLVFALVAFVVLGVFGLLWFGIQQIF